MSAIRFGNEVLEQVLDPLLRYRLKTIWRFHAPIKRVWDVLYDVEHWPRFWPGVKGATPAQDGQSGSLIWAAPMGYQIVTHFQPITVLAPTNLAGLVSGDLHGTGIFRLSMNQGITTVHYDFNVRLNGRLKRLLSPIARPLFIWNHHELMRKGGLGLARHIGVTLLGDR